MPRTKPVIVEEATSPVRRSCTPLLVLTVPTATSTDTPTVATSATIRVQNVARTERIFVHSERRAPPKVARTGPIGAVIPPGAGAAPLKGWVAVVMAVRLRSAGCGRRCRRSGRGRISRCPRRYGTAGPARFGRRSPIPAPRVIPQPEPGALLSADRGSSPRRSGPGPVESGGVRCGVSAR
ncbi:MAG: hypothetical protein HOV87_01715 [Catenulispora sp.]|nr:hypothetical protein [Catenulispora sp.]